MSQVTKANIAVKRLRMREVLEKRGKSKGKLYTNCIQRRERFKKQKK
jgi:predicted DNA-binding transcriptional regulator AlpA